MDLVAQAGGGIVAVADSPAGIRIGRSRPFLRRLDRRRGPRSLKGDPVVPAHQAAGLHEAGCQKIVAVDDDPRPPADAGTELVRLVVDQPGEAEGLRADREAVADTDAEPFGKPGLGDQARHVVLGSDQVVQARARRVLQREGAVQGIGIVDRLDLDQRLLVGTRQARHCPKRGDLGDAAERVEIGARVGLDLAVDDSEGEVAAEDRLALLGNPVDERTRYRADGGDRRNAERDAADEDVETAQATA